MEILIAIILTVVVALYSILKNRKTKQEPVELPPLPKTPEPVQTQRRYNSPPIPDEIPYPFDYQADWWKELSQWYRSQKDWQCEECDISLNDDWHLLHTHHIRGTQYNEPTDLKALCIGCHADQPGDIHDRLRYDPDYTHFIEKYGKQWRLYRYLNIGDP
jgi:hypothetical protein